VLKNEKTKCVPGSDQIINQSKK